MKKCELLVPAGGVSQLIAAVENGADAVYIGGKLFNARINAGNFDNDEVVHAVKFAHKRCVKIYVAMNTLISDDEMEQALKYAAFLYGVGVDALIIQDAGLAMMIKSIMPDFSLHLSTQGSVYDLRGVEAAERMGYDRVVTARELSFKEIKDVCRGTDMEIEVFVHGAMCICYSGQCQMSRYFGGRSGNRGQCAQPCRLPYKILDKSGQILDTFKYPLSPKDLCLINHIGDLAEAGVASLKIEGRMKSAEYVAVVTSIYRKYLDKYYRRGHYSVSAKDWSDLEQIFNRGGFTQGYYDENPNITLISGHIPKHQGVKIGKVVKRVPGGQLIDVEIYDKLSIGDGIEIQSEEITGNVVTYIKEMPDNITRIGDIKGCVRSGEEVYKITSKSLLEEARSTFNHKSYHSGKFIKRTDIDMFFGCNDDGKTYLTVRHKGTGISVTTESGPFEKATKRPTDKPRIEQSLRKTGGTPFRIDVVTFTGDFDRIIPISSINDMRRKALKSLETALESNVASSRTKISIPTHVCEVFSGKETSAQEDCVELFFYDFKTYENFVMWKDLQILQDAGIRTTALIPIAEFEENYSRLRKDMETIPYISNISKGREDEYIYSHFNQIVEHCKDRCVYAGNLSWIQPFIDAGVTVYGDYGLNVYNKHASCAYGMLGISRCTYSLESAKQGLGSYPLMASEYRPKGRLMIDRKKEKIHVVKRWFSSQTLLVPDMKEIDIAAVKREIGEKKGSVRLYII